MKEFDSDVFRKSVKLASAVRKLVHADMVKLDQYTIGSQMIRSSLSIPSNIAEGFGRNSNAQIVQFLNIAYASCCEVMAQIMVLSDSNAINLDKAKELIESSSDIKHQLYKLMRSFK